MDAMAWDDITFCDVKGMSGDKPMDEMTHALKRIAGHYDERFSRLPTLAEILYLLDVISSSHPGRYIREEGQQAMTAAICKFLVSHHGGQGVTVDPLLFEGAFKDEPEPGYYIIQKKATNREPEVEVI